MAGGVRTRHAFRPRAGLALSAIVLLAACTSGAASGEAFSVDYTPPAATGISDFAFFICNGLEGTWQYIFNGDFGQGIAREGEQLPIVPGSDRC